MTEQQQLKKKVRNLGLQKYHLMSYARVQMHLY